ncbi:MAG: class I SAM-dependent methyltransferase [Candidatus Wukongarchaeota archaeon]|nr:class I SAM-dependent methyltransferase [Candidatus Wukongarchaeota archaeon]
MGGIMFYNFYNLSKYYDIAFSRDISREVEFFIHCFKNYTSFEVKRILEPACGSGILLVAFAKQGYNITGYDSSPKMVEYAKERIEKSGYADKADVVLGDMRTMTFNPKFDVAINLINSLGYCLSNNDLISHFGSIAESLRKGGLYIVEISCACKDITNEKKPDEIWFSEREGIKIEAAWCPESYDLTNKIRHVNFMMKVEDGGKFFVFEEKHDLRLWFFEDFERMVQEAGFKIKAIYDQNYDLILNNDHITGELGALYYVLVKE